MTTLPYPQSQRAPLLAQLAATLVGGLTLFFAALILWVVGYQLLYAGRIFPGVLVAGVDLSGLSPQEAALTLSQRLSYPLSGKVLFRDGEKVWVASPAQLGLVFDPSTTAQAAYRLGRSGSLFQALEGQLRARGSGYAVSPVVVFDQRVAHQFLQGLAQQVNRPVVEAGLHLEGTNVVATPGQSGRVLNVEATLIYLSAQLQTFRDGEVPLVIQEVQPQVLDVSAQAETARAVLSQPMQLFIPNAQPGDARSWVYDVQVLANMLGVQRVQNGDKSEVQLTLNSDALRQILEGIQTQVDRPAANARFHFDENSGQLVLLSPSLSGRSLDISASLQAIQEALLRGEHAIPLVVRETQPAVTDTATAQQLGITQLLPNGVQTTYFWGSSAERIQNIQTAAARFDGLLVAPGETFSMGQALGDVSLDNGFTEALIIYGGRTIKGVGGGVCQVSTTLFRTVFFAGFPIVERVPHAYRVSYYEETSSGASDPRLAGLDATVYFPLVDFKFKNDTPYWLLMETNVDVSSRALTWRLYSTYDGRTVTWQTSGPQNIVPAPEPLFKENPDLRPGQIKQVDWAANGADVIVNRTVWKNGAVYLQDEVRTHYQPWQAVCEYAPGMEEPRKVAKRKGLCIAPST